MTVAALSAATSCKKWEKTEKDGYVLIVNKNGKTLGLSQNSSVGICEADGYAFKDLNRNGKLDVYEDWRLPYKDRAEDLASQLSIEEIAGLMLYSPHQSIPALEDDDGVIPYGGKPFAESGAKSWELSDKQKKFLTEDYLRHVLVTNVESPEVAARWNNTVQAFVEGLGHGIPANNSSDPRHSARSDSEYNAGGGGEISMWPGSLGIAATFDPSLMLEFGKIASTEYRALGFATALSPQVDLGTDPRWLRYNGTFGEDPTLSTEMAKAYCDGFQSDSRPGEALGGWGELSVNAMVKHWPGGGPCEAGRDAHYGFGKYSVYPGGNLALHKQPFTEGAFKLDGATGMASAVMPYYTISWEQSDEKVANGYNYDILTRQLREEHSYEGVICTDWCITANYTDPGLHDGKPWGVEDLSIAERHFKALMAGVDQFGGVSDEQPILEAYRMGVEKMGEEAMQKRMQQSAARLLMNVFRTGLFENPYLDPAQSAAIVGSPEYMKAGYDAQIRSVVMLKNHNSVLPLKNRAKVYIPTRHDASYMSFWGFPVPANDVVPVTDAILEKYYERAATPQEAEFAIVFIKAPNSGYGYDSEKHEYIPISLQYGDYTATTARAKSIAGGDPFEKSDNRSYRGKSVKTFNKSDMTLVQQIRKQMGDKPVIVVINVSNPLVMSEIEPIADAVLLGFDVQNQVILDLVSGKAEPSALLPFQMPADMLTVEEQLEDTPMDMRCYEDADGNAYDFAFGLNWQGTINDKRVEKYKKKVNSL